MNNDLQKLDDAISQIQNYAEKAQDYLPGIVRNYRKLEGDLDEARRVASILADGLPTNIERAWAEKMVASWRFSEPTRLEYKLSPEDWQELYEACISSPYVAGRLAPVSTEIRISKLWQRFGKKYGFNCLTVQPVEGKEDEFFTAEPEK